MCAAYEEGAVVHGVVLDDRVDNVPRTQPRERDHFHHAKHANGNQLVHVKVFKRLAQLILKRKYVCQHVKLNFLCVRGGSCRP